jgi:MEMO1 family protein
MNRYPAVAGTFYPGKKVDLIFMIEDFMQNLHAPDQNCNPLGIIAPHAGYFYSGKCAAYSYNALKGRDFKTAIIVAPSHRIGGFSYSVGCFDKYETPLGKIDVNKKFCERLLEHPESSFLPEVHKNEHSLETQLPFLQSVNRLADIVPVIFGDQTIHNAKRLAEILYQEFHKDLDDVVFIVSSDLSHYHDAGAAKKMDMNLAHLIEKNEIHKLEQGFEKNKFEACGFGGILMMMYLSRKVNASKIVNLNYTHSGEINNDNDQVVGYLSTVFCK